MKTPVGGYPGYTQRILIIRHPAVIVNTQKHGKRSMK